MHLKGGNRTGTENRTDVFIFLALVFGAFLFGFLLLNRALFHYDAIVLAEAVEKTFATGRLQPSTNFRYGDVVLASFIYFPFWLFGHNADFAVRLTGLLFFSLAVGAVYLFVSNFLRSKVAGLSSAVLLAVAPVALSVNTFGKVQGVSLFFLLLSFWLVLVPSRFRLVAGAFFFVVSLASREAMLFFVPFLFVLVGYSLYYSRASWREGLFFLVPFFVLFLLLWFAYFGMSVLRAVFPTNVQQAGFAFDAGFLLRGWQDLLLTNGLLVLVSGILGLLLGLPGFSSFFLLCWFVLSVFYFSNFTTYEARYLDVALLALFAGAGLVVERLLRWQKVVGFVFFALLLVLPVSYSRELMLPRTVYNGPFELGMLILNKTESDSIIVVQNEAPVVGYYGKRRALGPPVDGLNASVVFWSEVRRNVSQGQNVWMTGSALFDDPLSVNKQLVSQMFEFSESYYLLDEDYHHSDIRHVKFVTFLVKLAPRREGSPRAKLLKPVLLKGFPEKLR